MSRGDFPTWERQVEPQGFLRIPQEGPTLADSFGAGLQDVAAAGTQFADTMERVDQYKAKQQFDIDSQTAIKSAVDFSNTSDQQFRDAAKNAPEGAAGFTDQQLAAFDKAAAEKRKTIPASQYDYWDEQTARLRGNLEGKAAEFQDTSRVKFINDQSNEVIGAGASQLVTAPEKLPFIQSNVVKSIAALDATPEEKKALVKTANQQLQVAALGGQIENNPRAALAAIDAGQWNGVEAPKLAAFRHQATQQIKVDEEQAKSDARQAEAEARANFGIVFNDAVSTAANTGVQKSVTDNDIDKHYTGAAAVVMKRQLHTAEAEGVARLQVSGTTHDQDQAWLDANAPKPGQEFTGDQAKVYQAGAEAIDAKRKALAAEIADDLKDSTDQNQQTVASKIDDWSQKAFADGAPPAEAAAVISEAYAGDPTKRAKATAALQQSADLGNQFRAVGTNAPDQDEALQSGLDAAASSGSATAADEAAKVQEAITKKRAAFAGNDPAGAALQTSPAVADAWTAFQQSPQDKAALRQAIALTQSEQTRQNVRNPVPLPASVATSITSQIMSQPAPKDQLAALLQFTDFGDAQTTNAVLAQLVGTKGVPDGTDLVLDIAQTDKARAEKVWTAMRADTKGVELPKEAKDSITSGLQSGLVGVLSAQASITGNSDAATALAGPVINAATQYAKAQVMLGADGTAAGTQAVADLTGQYALIHDPSLAEVYYPKQIEATAPGAMEAGLKALRTDAAKSLKPQQRPGAPGTKEPPNPYADATVRDVASSAVWVNNGAGFALIVPGSNRALSFVTAQQARDRGIVALKANPQTNAPPLPVYAAPFMPLGDGQ